MIPYKAVVSIRKVGVRAVALLAGSLLLTAAAQPAASSDGAGRAWTSADSIAIRYFGPYIGGWSDNAKKPAGVFSPDRQYFHVLSYRGDLADDSIVQTMEVYETAQVRQWLNGGDETPLAPRTQLERRLYSRDSGVALGDVRWASDSRSITFVSRTVREQDQIFRLHIPSGRLEPLTDDTYQNKTSYRMEGDFLLYAWTTPVEETVSRPYPVIPIPRDADGEVSLKGGSAGFGFVALRVGGAPWEVPGRFNRDFDATFSRDAQHAVLLSRDLRGAKGAPAVSTFSLVDFTQQRSGELSEGWSETGSKATPQALWQRDGASIVLVSTILPEGVNVDGRNLCLCIASYELASSRWQILEPMQEDGTRTTKKTEQDIPSSAGGLRRQVQSVRMLGTGELLVSYAPGTNFHTRYQWKDRRWIGRRVPGSAPLPSSEGPGPIADGLKVQVRQSQNDPPRLVVSDGRREKTLSRLDPALEGVWRARLEPFATRTPDGMEVKGALSLPREAQKPLPLVIQIGYDHDTPDLFLPDGPAPVAFARQGLNARGMAVLSLDATVMANSKKRYTPQEGPGVVDQIDAAVEVLAGQGLIDRTRVGVVGFSRTGYQTFYAVTHPKKTSIAAAEIFDATTFSYPQYLDNSLLGAGAPSERMHAGSFWQNKATWLENDVLFNVDRMEAATLFMEVSGVRRMGQSVQDHTLLTVAKIGALTLTQRPFEMLFIPDGTHAPRLPRQHQVSLEATVDWMAFWLRGYEDPAPEKAQQYVRWRQIRERNEQRKAAAKTAAAR